MVLTNFVCPRKTVLLLWEDNSVSVELNDSRAIDPPHTPHTIPTHPPTHPHTYPTHPPHPPHPHPTHPPHTLGVRKERKRKMRTVDKVNGVNPPAEMRFRALGKRRSLALQAYVGAVDNSVTLPCAVRVICPTTNRREASSFGKIIKSSAAWRTTFPPPAAQNVEVDEWTASLYL
ncbi:hypothetical protein C0Q70_16084 [Pomacea canaliculata]|uniref:Uncharacterized protein n=1 Tax=Pomacea canaliculata TaxID=400727 RepID=A0A2T7NNT4_POMCA|nr:hypothetical protein C0Q70_16084 [Pomacea canaliculata]